MCLGLEYDADCGAGEFCCPSTYKLFNEHTHIVAVRTTGNVYSMDTIQVPSDAFPPALHQHEISVKPQNNYQGFTGYLFKGLLRFRSFV